MMEREGSDHGPQGRTAGPFRSVLVATDLSDGSDTLVQAAAEIAGRSGAALHVVHSADVLSASALGTQGSFEDRCATADATLARQIGRLVPPALAATRHTGASAPDITIMDQAADVAADLIVLGPHVRAAGGGGLLGTTAERVLSTSRVPCLVVRTPLLVPSHHVTAAVDPGHLVSSVLEIGIEWALLFGGAAGYLRPRLSALYITSARGGGPPPALEHALHDALARSGAAERIDAAVEIRGTDVVESILLFAEAEASDLLVLATHNRGVLGRALLGSVSAEVTRRSPCNVLLVPPRHEAGA